MQLKNPLLLFTALTAGTAVARIHGHERRQHQHAVRHIEDFEKRDGDMVTATIDGKVVSWKNNYSGGAPTEAPKQPAPTEAPAVPAPSTTDAPDVNTSEVEKPTSGASSDWTNTPPEGQASREGFGTAKPGNTAPGNDYVGTTWEPWGSNIIEVAADKAKDYNYVVQITNKNDEPWAVVFWNKIGPKGGMNGWYQGNEALRSVFQPGEVKYVAFDADSQGGWGAFKGDKAPTDHWGGYACTWGEFDFGSIVNGGKSGWDVSAIQAQNAGLDVQGMSICDHNNQKCSSITKALKEVLNAYTSNLAGVNGIGGSLDKGPVRLIVNLEDK